MTVPVPTPIYGFLHVDNLQVCLSRGVLHAPNHTPQDGLMYKTIHHLDIQQQRKIIRIPCGPRGVIHDYVAFYFGYLSPMLLQLKTGQVAGYNEGQEPLIYLTSSAQVIMQHQMGFVFSDGHGIAFDTQWYDELRNLDKVDWSMVYQIYWAADYEKDMDRQRRKQAEFLIYQQCDWSLIREIGVFNDRVKTKVERILAGFHRTMNRPVNVRPQWYY